MNFEECLKRGKIKEFSQGQFLVQKELATAEKDLLDGQEGLQREKYKWTVIQSYYAMFHTARALLYAKNYREKSHFGLIIAIRHLYVETEELSVYFIESLQKGKDLREDADYYDDWSKIGAEEMLALAKEFLTKTKEILHKSG